MVGAAFAATWGNAAGAFAETAASGKALLSLLAQRRSVRSFTDAPVSDEEVQAMLAAAMSAPSAGNEQPWEFIVVRSKETLEKAGSVNPYAGFAKSAPLAILTCVNQAHEKHAGYGVLDVAACTENLLLAAHALGLGAVWTGIYPMEDRILKFRSLLALPETVLPIAFVVIGHPKATPEPANRFNPQRIHAEKW